MVYFLQISSYIELHSIERIVKWPYIVQDGWFVEVVIKLPLDETQKRQLHKLNMITISEQ